RHLCSRTEIQTAAVTLHELLHLCEDWLGRQTKAPANGYHTSEFRKTAAALGIPSRKFGHECGVVPGSPFATWAETRGLQGKPVLYAQPSSAAPISKPKR